MNEITISSEFITLTQFLKLANFISSGGEAKFFLSTEYIEVNGEEENRRGKKLYPGDVVKVQDSEYVIKAE